MSGVTGPGRAVRPAGASAGRTRLASCQLSVTCRLVRPPRARRSSGVSGASVARAAARRSANSAAGFSTSSRRDPARQVPHRHREPVSAEGAHQTGALAEARPARRVQPRESVQKPLLGVRHDPAQMVLLRRLAPVRGVHALELDGRDGRGVGPLQGGGHLRRGVLRVRDPELEAAVHFWLEGALRRRADPAAADRRPGRGGPAPGVPGCASRARWRVSARSRLMSPDAVSFCRPSRTEPSSRRRAGQAIGSTVASVTDGDALGQAVLEGQFDRGRRDQLAQGHPVALAGQPLEGAVHQLGRGVRGGPAVAGLVAAAAAAGAGFAGADDRDLSPSRDLRALGLRLGSLLGHRGCLPVTARLVRSRA